MMKRFYFLLTVFFLFSAPLHAVQWQEIAAQLQASGSVQGDFVQQRRLKSLNVPLTVSGEFVLARRVLLWKTHQPFADKLRVCAQGIEQFSPEQNRWQPQRNGAQVKIFLALLGGDPAGLQQHFDFRVSGSLKDWRLHLTPKTALMRQIFLKIDVAGGQTVQNITLYEKQGDVLDITFGRVQTGIAPTPADRADLAC